MPRYLFAIFAMLYVGCGDENSPGPTPPQGPDRTIGTPDNPNNPGDLPPGAMPLEDGQCPDGMVVAFKSGDQQFCVTQASTAEDQGVPDEEPDAAVDPEPDAGEGCPPSEIEEGWMTCRGYYGELVREEDCRWYFYFEGDDIWSSGTERGVYGNCQEILNE